MKRTPDPAVCSSWIGGGTPVEKPDTDNGQMSSKDKK